MRIADRYQDIGSEHYEDILATATLNKLWLDNLVIVVSVSCHRTASVA
ncbi:hypothetical protein Avbf_17988 [Armadillidium vulgare]|nr:hypothetical protein Avbf_17988 [Armadillidium vulgare]